MSSQFEQTTIKAKSIFKKTLWILLGVLLLVGIVYYVYRTSSYSEGTRTGVLFKVSKKGNIFKTYEGQLLLAGSALVTKQSVFDFSVKDVATYTKMQSLEGKTVKVHYNQLYDSFPWQGDQDYIVDMVEEVK